MRTKRSRFELAVILLIWGVAASGQQAPPASDKAWAVTMTSGPSIPGARPQLDPDHVYSLAELVDLAERGNPETRVLWERAKQKAAAAGIARSALLPAIAVAASPSINQYSLFFGKFYHEDTALLPAIASLTWTVFDFGARSSRIDQARVNLLAADHSFNEAHREIIFHVAEAYYHLLDAMSQEDAAQAAVTDAATIQQALEEKLANGLATLPDVLEARAAAAQARYELTSIQGLEAIARGNLATVMGASPRGSFQVQGASRDLPEIGGSLATLVETAIAQRPDLLAKLAAIRSAEAGIKSARSAFYPQIAATGEWGHVNGFGEQKNFGSSAESRIFPYQAQLKITWNVFDGGARRNALESARSVYREAQAEAEVTRDQIENEVWGSYTRLRTSEEQQKAAAALFEAAEESYTAASEAFSAGVKTFLDVTTAQRNLARARAAQATARIQLLADYADLAFRAGDPMRAMRR